MRLSQCLLGPSRLARSSQAISLDSLGPRRVRRIVEATSFEPYSKEALQGDEIRKDVAQHGSDVRLKWASKPGTVLLVTNSLLYRPSL